MCLLNQIIICVTLLIVIIANIIIICAFDDIEDRFEAFLCFDFLIILSSLLIGFILNVAISGSANTEEFVYKTQETYYGIYKEENERDEKNYYYTTNIKNEDTTEKEKVQFKKSEVKIIEDEEVKTDSDIYIETIGKKYTSDTIIKLLGTDIYIKNDKYYIHVPVGTEIKFKEE
jgi:hypothetical protein